MPTSTTSPLKSTDLTKFPRKVAVLVCDLVNNHDVPYRMQKGNGHIYLYNGSQGERPYKISASRPEESTLRYLYPWIEENVPSYAEREVTDEGLEGLAQAVNTTEREVEDAVDAEPQGRRHFYSDGTESVFTVRDGVYYCGHCDWKAGGKRGLHLHERVHTGTQGKWAAAARKGAETRSLLAAQRKEVKHQALRTLAEAEGYVLLTKAEVAGLREGKSSKKDREIERLKSTIQELKAKVALIKEAMSA